jgi:hypothetical protein
VGRGGSDGGTALWRPDDEAGMMLPMRFRCEAVALAMAARLNASASS